MPVQPSHAVLEQAAQWYALLHSAGITDGDRARWRQWLAADAAHQSAWRHVEDISAGFAPLQDGGRLAADALLQADTRLRQRRRALLSVAALAGTGLVGTALWRQGWLPQPLLAWQADHRNDTGQQREIAMSDGTRIWLNTASAINLRYTAAERRIALVAGEVFIATAHDATARPFLVTTGQGSLRALGTRFNVREQAGRTHLAVYEGAVEIRTAATDHHATIHANQQARFTVDAIATPEAADPARQAWTRGVLLANDLTLREFAHELARYRPGRIGVADEAAELKVYGSFPTQDTDRALTMLADALPVRISQPLPWWVRIERR